MKKPTMQMFCGLLALLLLAACGTTPQSTSLPVSSAAVSAPASSSSTSSSPVSAVQRELLPENYILSTIVGEIGEAVIGLEDRDGQHVALLVDVDTLQATKEVALKGTLLDYRFRGNELQLMFEDRVDILDKSLTTIRQVPLPQILVNIIARPASGDEDFGTNRYVEFGGYDFTSDFSTFIYSTEKGLFLLDAASGTQKQLCEAEYLDLGGDFQSLKTPMAPYVTNDGKGVYCAILTYERTSYMYYAWSTQTITHLDVYSNSMDILDYYTPACAGMGYYFHVFYTSSLYIGTNYYYLFDFGEDVKQYIGSASNTISRENALDITYKLDGSSYVSYVFADGRLVCWTNTVDVNRYEIINPFE